MSHKYNKEIETIKRKKEESFNRYWRNVSKKMAIKYFWECKILKREYFKMTFMGEYDERKEKFYDPDFVPDDVRLISYYASKNGLGIYDVKLLGNKSIYWFGKSDLFKT